MQTTIPFETCFDLESGSVVDRVPHGVVFQNQSQQVQIAHPAEGFEQVNADDIGTLDFTTSLVDVPFDSAVVLLTGAGNYYKLGPVEENESLLDITFEWILVS